MGSYNIECFARQSKKNNFGDFIWEIIKKLRNWPILPLITLPNLRLRWARRHSYCNPTQIVAIVENLEVTSHCQVWVNSWQIQILIFCLVSTDVRSPVRLIDFTSLGQSSNYLSGCVITVRTDHTVSGTVGRHCRYLKYTEKDVHMCLIPQFV